MRLDANHVRQAGQRRQAFTLVEVMIGVAAIGLMFVTFYAAFTQGFGVVQLARENLRATQILEEKMETIRLYTWEQINAAGFIPKTFTAPYYAVGTNVTGLIYTGETEVSDVNLPGASYSSDLKLVTVRLTWRSGNIDRSRETRTLVSRYGLQQYIY